MLKLTVTDPLENFRKQNEQISNAIKELSKAVYPFASIQEQLMASNNAPKNVDVSFNSLIFRANFQDRIQPMINKMQSIDTSMQLLSKAISTQPIINKMQSINTSIQLLSKAISTHMTLVHVNYLPVISYLIGSAVESSDKYYVLLNEHDYPPYNDLDFRLMKELVDYSESHENAETASFLESTFLEEFTDDKIEKIMLDWSRMDINCEIKEYITNSLKSHMLGNYKESTFDLVTQFEGIIGEIKSKEMGEPVRLYVNKELKAVFPYDVNSLNMRTKYNKAMFEFYITKVLGEFKHGEPIKFPLNRHAICHGGHRKYGTHINSIRAIILMDNLLSTLIESNKLRYSS